MSKLYSCDSCESIMRKDQSFYVAEISYSKVNLSHQFNVKPSPDGERHYCEECFDKINKAFRVKNER